MLEEWALLEEFPGYEISTFGRVINSKRRTILKPQINQDDICFVKLMRDGVQFSRSMALLTARTFISNNNPAFNSIIHLDGDKTNCAISNLMWRPRHFVPRYYDHFKYPWFYMSREVLQIIQTEETFVGYEKPCIKYGLRAIDVRMSWFHKQKIPFTSIMFRRLQN